DAVPVANHEQTSRTPVPNGKGKHATQVLYAIPAVFFIEMQNRLSVALGAITMAARLQVRSELLMVVDFAVVNDPEVFVFVGDRLVAGGNIDDAEAAHGQPDITFDKEAVIVRPAMDDLMIHLLDPAAFNQLACIRIENSANSAHC